MYAARLRVRDMVADKVRWFLGNLPSDDVEVIEDDVLVDTTSRVVDFTIDTQLMDTSEEPMLPLILRNPFN